MIADILSERIRCKVISLFIKQVGGQFFSVLVIARRKLVAFYIKKIKMADYKKTLAKWAARTGATTRMWREDCAEYVDGKKVGTKTFINLNCDLIPRTVQVEKAADQSVAQAEQACAQQFLKSFASAPVHK